MAIFVLLRSLSWIAAAPWAEAKHDTAGNEIGARAALIIACLPPVATPAHADDSKDRAAANVLNTEEADEIATHFPTEGGREQRVVVELLLLGETVL